MAYYRYKELKALVHRFVERMSPGALRVMASMEGSFMLILAASVALYVY